jgi:hypothetical protein
MMWTGTPGMVTPARQSIGDLLGNRSNCRQKIWSVPILVRQLKLREQKFATPLQQ